MDWKQAIRKNTLERLYPCNSKPQKGWFEFSSHFFSSQRDKIYLCSLQALDYFFPPLSFSFPWPFLFSVSLSLPSCGWSYVAEEPYLIWEGKQRKASAFVCIYIYVYLNIHIHLSLCKCVYENPPHLRTHQGITMYFYVYLHKYTHTHTPFHIDFVLITMRMKKQQEGAARTTVFTGP